MQPPAADAAVAVAAPSRRTLDPATPLLAGSTVPAGAAESMASTPSVHEHHQQQQQNLVPETAPAAAAVAAARRPTPGFDGLTSIRSHSSSSSSSADGRDLADGAPDGVLGGDEPELDGSGPSAAAAALSRAYNAALALCSTQGPGAFRRAYFLNQVLAVCGGANAADAVEVLSVSFLLPHAEKDLSLSGVEKGWLAGCIFGGMMIGGWVWGALSDRIGRKKCLLACLLINGIGGLLSAMAPAFPWMLLCRFIAGIGVGGSVPVMFTMFGEVLSTRARGFYLVCIAFCWMLGALVTALAAWIIIPRRISFDVAGMQVHSWRVFAAVCALPSLMCAAALSTLPESPRWLLSPAAAAAAPSAAGGGAAEGEHDPVSKAKSLLVAMYEVNHRDAILLSEMTMPSPEVEADGVAPVSPAEAAAIARDREDYIEELSRGRLRNIWCGACCIGRIRRRNRGTASSNRLARPFDPAAALAAASSASSAPASPNSAAESAHAHSNTSATHAGSHGVSYSQLADGIDGGGSGGGSSARRAAAAAATASSSFVSPKAAASPSSSSSTEHLALTMPSSASQETGLLSSPGADEEEAFRAAEGGRVLSLRAVPTDGSDASEAFFVALSERERWGLFVAALDELGRASRACSAAAQRRAWDEAASSPSRLLDGESSSSSDSDASLGNTSRFARLRHFCSTVWRGTKEVVSQTLSMFSAKSGTRGSSIKLVLVWFFLAFGYYGLTIWMPQYFEDRAAAEEAAAGGGGGGGGGAGGDDDDDDEGNKGNAQYVTAVIGALSALPANTASLWSVRAWGRVRTLVASLFLSGLCVLIVPLLGSSASASAAEALLAVFNGVNTASWNALNISTTELYATHQRATAFGFHAAAGRIGAILGNLMFGLFSGTGANAQVLPLFCTAAALLAAAVAAVLLPETKDANLA